MPEVKRMLQAKAEARLEGREEGRADVLRDLLIMACEQQGHMRLGQRAAIAHAGAAQMKIWLGRLISGEKLEAMLEEGGP
jgi:hypothetical protein